LTARCKERILAALVASSPARLGLLALLVALAGCRSAADRAASSVKITVNGASQTLAYGKATPEYDGLDVRLQSEPFSCKELGRASELAFHVDPGPGGRFYASSPVGVAIFHHGAGEPTVVESLRGSAVTLEPFAYAKGERLRGSVDFDFTTASGKTKASGAGTFDVEICEKAGDSHLMAAPHRQPESVQGTVKGTFAGQPFESAGALVEWERDRSTGEAYVSQVLFFSQPTTCDAASKPWNVEGDHLRVYDIGAGKKAPFGSPRPAEASAGKQLGAGSPETFLGEAWIQLDGLKLEAGSRVKGAVYADSRPGTRPDQTGTVGGEFEATVCPMSR